MWTIRQDQTEAFRQAHLKRFEDEMVEHLQKFSPQHSKMVGDAGTRQLIRLGMDNASKYGLSNRGPLRFYMELMFMFGSYFDTDPQHPWASTVLMDRKGISQEVCADRLFEAMNDFKEEIVDPERKHLIESLQEIRNSRVEDCLPAGVRFEDAMLQCVQSACPIRSEYLGESVLRKLVLFGSEIARRFDFKTDRGIALIVAMVFLGGHGFFRDPQYWWIAKGLDAKQYPDEKQRVEYLCSQSGRYLDSILSGERINQ